MLHSREPSRRAEAGSYDPSQPQIRIPRKVVKGGSHLARPIGSLAAAPAVPGWSLGTIAYHTSVEASGNVAAARQISIGQVPATANVNLNARGDLLFIAPTYTFATPVLGGQLGVGVIGVVGHLDTSITGTLTAQVGPIVATRSGVLSDLLTGVDDLYPLVTLKWNQGATIG